MGDLRYALSRHVLLERENGGDKLIVIDSRTGVICMSNTAASMLLQDFEEGVSASDLAAKLARRFGIAEGSAREDAQAFLDQLSTMGFIDLTA